MIPTVVCSLIFTADSGSGRLSLHLDPVLGWPVSCSEDSELGVGYPKSSLRGNPRQRQINLPLKTFAALTVLLVPAILHKVDFVSALIAEMQTADNYL